MLTRLIVLMLTMLLIGTVALANPSGGEITGGEATIINNNDLTQINQTSQKAIINWQSFNIEAHQKTHFEQPNGGITLNRIRPTEGPSQIFGQLSATGKVILINQAGIFFGPGAVVNVGGIIASTANISDQNFLAGKLIFDQPSLSRGSIINQGTINAADYGLVALMGTGVVNNGVINARLGSVVLASGNKFTVDLNGDQLINFSIDEGTTSAGVDQNGNSLKNGVHNDGSLFADGGTILVTGKNASKVVDHVINMEGVAEARTVYNQKGTIVLGANEGNVRVKGKLIATGKTGGKIKILGKRVRIKSTAKIDVSGDEGGGEILIGGNYQGKGPEINALKTTVETGATLSADALTLGNGGRIIIWSDDQTYVHGAISARGGSSSGDGGFVETSGHYLDTSGATVDLRATKGTIGTWLLDPTNVVIDNSANSNLTIGGTTYQPTDGSQATTVINATSLATALNSASIIVTTTAASGSGGGGSGDISVNSSLTWTGATTLTLNALNDININADISAVNGGLTLISGNIVTIPSNINTGIGLSITPVNGYNDITGNISGTGSLTLANHLFHLYGTNTYSGGTILNGASVYFNNVGNFGAATGSFTLDSASLHPNASVTFNSNQSFTLNNTGLNVLSPVNNSDTITINGSITGTGALRITNLNIGSANNTYSGQTQISGTFNYNAVNAISSNSNAFLFSSAIVNMNDYSSTLKGLNGISGAVFNLGSNANTVLTIDSSNFGSTFSGAINGAGSIVKTNVGTQTFSGGLNTYSGSTTVTAGSLRISSDQDLGTAPSTPTTNAIVLSGGSITMMNSMTLNANRGITVSNDVTLRVDTSGPIVGIYNGIIQGSGILRLVGGINGGSLNIGGNNTYTSDVRISGVVNVNSDAALGQSVSGKIITLNTGSTLSATQSFNLSANKSIQVIGTPSISVDSGKTFGILGTIDGTGITANLNLIGLGSINLGGIVGGTTPLTTMTSQSTLTNLDIGNNVTTTGIQTYNSPVTVSGSPATLTTTNSVITFANTLNGPGGLTLAAGTAAVNFNSTVGTTSALSSLASSSSSSTVTFTSALGSNLQPLGSLNINGNVVLNGGSVYSSGSQLYSGTVTLGADTTLTTGTSITFANTLSGAGRNLTLQGTGSSGNSFLIQDDISINNLTVTGGSGINTLAVDTSSSLQIWTISGNNAGTLTGLNNVTGSFGFSNMQSLSGGSNSDAFIFSSNGTLGSNISGEGGVNYLEYSSYGSAVTINLQTNSSTAISGTFSNITQFTGYLSSTLVGADVNNSWNILVDNEGTLNGGITFSSFSNLTGGTGDDTFIFDNAARITGNLTGGGGLDTLDLSAYLSTVTVNIGDGTATGLTGGTFSGLSNFIGTDSTLSTLIGPSTQDNVWAIASLNSGDINTSTYTFSGFGNIEGNVNSDTNSFVFTGTGGFDGNVIGGSIEDTLDFTGVPGSPQIDVSLTGAGTNHGFSGTTSAVIGGSFDNIDIINNTTSSLNTLTGPNSSTTWQVGSTANSGTVTDDNSLQTIAFNSFPNLIGQGSDNTLEETVGNIDWSITSSNGGSITGVIDSFSGMQSLVNSGSTSNFIFSDGVNFSGSIQGSGNDVLDYSAHSALNPIEVSISNNNFGSVESNSITTNFGGISTMIGSAGDDSFNINNTNAYLTGDINGGSGIDTLSAYSLDSGFIVNLTDFTSDRLGGNFSNIENFEGTAISSLQSTLIGPNNNNIWTIDGTDTGDINGLYTFDLFGNITGGSTSLSNVFKFVNSGEISGNVTGGNTSDTLDFTDLTGSPTVNIVINNVGTTHGFTGTASSFIGNIFDNIDFINNTNAGNNTLTGANQSTDWTFTATNTGTLVDTNSGNSLGFTGFNNIIGGTDQDIFNFTNTSTLSGTLDGGDTSSSNQLNFANYPNLETMTLNEPIANVIDSGLVNDSFGSPIVDFTRIQSYTGDGESLIYPPSDPTVMIEFTNVDHLDGLIYTIPSLPFTFLNARIYGDTPEGGGTNPSEITTSTNGLDQIMNETANLNAEELNLTADLDISQTDDTMDNYFQCAEPDKKNMRICNKVLIFLSKNPFVN